MPIQLTAVFRHVPEGRVDQTYKIQDLPSVLPIILSERDRLDRQDDRIEAGRILLIDLVQHLGHRRPCLSLALSLLIALRAGARESGPLTMTLRRGK